MTAINNYHDVIDSRDVNARIDELIEQEGEDSSEELQLLTALSSEGTDYSPDWENGVGLIRDSYFETYAQELAEDIGAIDPNAAWPTSCIDWARAAIELQMDYSCVDFDGITYWVR